MTERLGNDFYFDFPDAEYDDRFSFPEELVRLRYDPESTAAISGKRSDTLFAFSIDRPEELGRLVVPRDYDRTSLYLGLEHDPLEYSTGFHRSIIYFATTNRAEVLAAGRGNLVVVRKWRIADMR